MEPLLSAAQFSDAGHAAFIVPRTPAFCAADINVMRDELTADRECESFGMAQVDHPPTGSSNLVKS